MKIAIVTGASSGIGREFAKQIDGYGFDEIWGIALDEEGLLTLKAEMKTKVVPLAMDLTKEESFEKQLHLALESATIENIAEGNRYAPVLHGYAALPLIRRDFPLFASEEILDAVRYHTTGKPHMSVLTAVVFLADYIEFGRKPENCVLARELFFEKTEKGTQSERLRALDESVLFALEKTKAFLDSQGCAVHPDTEKALAYYRAILA